MKEIDRLTAQVVHFRDERDWKQFHNPKDVALSLLLEASELLEIFQWKEGPAIDEAARTRRQALSDELADVLYYTLLLAHDQRIDLAAALAAKMEHNARKYPVHRARGSNLKYDEF